MAELQCRVCKIKKMDIKINPLMREVQVFCMWKDELESKTMSLGFQPANILSANETGGKVAIKSKGIFKNQKSRLNRTGGEDSSDSEAPRKINYQRDSDQSDKDPVDDSDNDVALFKTHNKPTGVSVLHVNPERPNYTRNDDKEGAESDDSAKAALF